MSQDASTLSMSQDARMLAMNQDARTRATSQGGAIVLAMNQGARTLAINRNRNMPTYSAPVVNTNRELHPQVTSNPYPYPLPSSSSQLRTGHSDLLTSKPPRVPHSQPPTRLPDTRLQQDSPETRMFQTLSRNLDASRQQIKQHMKSLENIDGYFMEMNGQITDKKRAYYKCLQCGPLIYNRKNRSKVAHFILCPETSMQIRQFFYNNCRANDRPPLLAKTFYGMTPSMARRLEKEKERRNNDEGETGDFGDSTKIPRCGQYVIARQKLKGSTRIKDCSEEEQKMATNLLLELLVEENLPFSICNKAGCHPRALGRLLDYLRPGYCLPLGYKVGGELLDRYYLDTVTDMKSRIKWMLQDSRATLMFDGSEDVNGAPMVNVLLRVMGSSRVDCTTFFLSTVYTGYDTVDADYYVRIAEKIITEFVGFESIGGVVTDNKGSVKNARETLESRHPRMVASQDQAHVADRLMADIGEIAWVRDTLKTPSMITSDVRRLRKLRARLLILMTEYNSDIEQKKAMGSNELSTEDVDEDKEEGGNQMEGNDLPGSEECQYEGDTFGSKHFKSRTSNVTNPSQYEAGNGCGFVEEGFLMSDVVLPSFMSDVRDEEEGIEDPEMVEGETDEPEGSEDGLEPKSVGVSVASNSDADEVTKTSTRRARMLKKVSNVRFASREKLLDEYLSIRPVLILLIDDPHFDQLYKAKNENERRLREERFTAPIRSEELKRRVMQLHASFQACRTYLRIFDSETCLISEVFEATRILKETLERLPLEFFPDPKKENREELLAVFMNRKEGPFPNMKRIKIRLISDLHITAAMLDPNRTPLETDPSQHFGAIWTGISQA